MRLISSLGGRPQKKSALGLRIFEFSVSCLVKSKSIIRDSCTDSPFLSQNPINVDRTSEARFALSTSLRLSEKL